MDPFIGEIRMFPFNFAPVGWAMCNGQLLPISQNTALFSILGTTYGGNGTSNFALPNLQGIVPLGFGNGPGLQPRVLGETAGETAVQLTLANLAPHTHTLSASTSPGTSTVSNGHQLGVAKTSGKGTPTVVNLYSAKGANATTGLARTAISVVGGGQPHNNLMPYLVLNFCIAMQGIFPPRS
jgi:microcystin-dependent protein